MEDISPKEKPKQVSFAPQQDLMENKVEKLEKIINESLSTKHEETKEQIDKFEKRLKRKQNEVNNLFETVNKYKETEEKLNYEINHLKQTLDTKNNESERLADELAVKAKEQMDNITVKDLKSELEDARKMLKRTTDENWIIKEKLRVEQETGQKKEREIGKLSCAVSDLESVNREGSMKENDIIITLEGKLANSLEVLESQNTEIQQLNDLVSQADEIVKEKEKDISWLNNMVHKDQMEIKVNDKKL